MPRPSCKDPNYHIVKHHTGGVIDRAYPVCCPKEATYSKHHVCIQESGGVFGIIGKHHVAHGRAHPVQMEYGPDDKLKCLDPSYRLVSHHKASDNSFFNQLKEKFTHLFGHGMNGSEKVCCPSLAPYAYDGKCFAEKTGLFVKDYSRPWVDVHGRPLAPVMPVPNNPAELAKFGIGVKKPAAAAPHAAATTTTTTAAAAPPAAPATPATPAAPAPALTTAVIKAAPAPAPAPSSSSSSPTGTAPAPTPVPKHLDSDGTSDVAAYRFDQPHALDDDELVTAESWETSGADGPNPEIEGDGAQQWAAAAECGAGAEWEQANVEL